MVVILIKSIPMQTAQRFPNDTAYLEFLMPHDVSK